MLIAQLLFTLVKALLCFLGVFFFFHQGLEMLLAQIQDYLVKEQNQMKVVKLLAALTLLYYVPFLLKKKKAKKITGSNNFVGNNKKKINFTQYTRTSASKH